MAIVNPKSKIVNSTIRVYGIYIKDGNVLLSQEKFNGMEMRKFPGGGLEFGEGTIECLKREMQEEFTLEIEVVEHFYTTDFFVSSAFHKNTQVITIYYLMDVLTSEIPVNIVFSDDKGEYTLYWQELSILNSHDLTFPIDQKVAGFIMAQFL